MRQNFFCGAQCMIEIKMLEKKLLNFWSDRKKIKNFMLDIARIWNSMLEMIARKLKLKLDKEKL